MALRVLTALALATTAAAFTFDLHPGSKKCFTSELGTFHRAELHYRMTKAHADLTEVTVTGPRGDMLVHHKPASKEHRDSFQPPHPGDYATCFKSSERAASSTSTFEVAFSLLSEMDARTSSTYDHRRVVSKANKLNAPLMRQATYIDKSIVALHDQYRVLKEREIFMRDTNESTNARTLWCTVMTLLFLAAVRGLHHVTLRRYLKSKKILE